MQVFATTGSRVVVLLVSIGSLALTARVLGPDGRGIVAGTLAWVGLVATLGSLSIGQVIIHRAASQKGPNQVAKLIGNTLALVPVLSVVCWVCLTILYLAQPEIFGEVPLTALLLGFAFLPFTIWEKFGSQLLVVTGHLGYFNRRQVWTVAVGFLVLCIGLLQFQLGPLSALTILLTASAVAAMSGLGRLLFAGVPMPTIAWQDIRRLIADGMKLHLNAIGGAMLSTVNVVMVNFYCSRSDTAYFQLAFQLFLTILIVPQAIGTVLSEFTARLGVDKVWQVQRRAVLAMTLLMLGIGGLAFWLAPILIEIVAGPDFSPAGSVFRILLLGLIGGSFAYVMANQWLGRGLFWQTALLTLAYGIGNVLLNIVLLPTLGIIGAAWANASVYGVSVVTNLWMAHTVERRYRASKGKP